MEVPEPQNIAYDENGNLIFISSNYDYYKNQTLGTSDLQALKSEIIGIATPSNLDSLKEIAQSFGNNANFLSDLDSSINLKAPILNPTFTGILEGSKALFSSDVSLNARLDISGVLTAKKAIFSSDVSLNSNTDILGVLTAKKSIFSSDVSLNSNTDISGVLTAKKAIFSSDVSFNGPVNFNSSIIAPGSSFVIGDAQTDSLVVNSNSIFNNNVQIGSSNSDILVSNATATHNGTQYYNSDVYFNTAQAGKQFYFSRSLGAMGYWNGSGSSIFIDGSNNTITSTNLNITGNTTLGNESTDVLTNNSTSTHNARNIFNSDVSFNGPVTFSSSLSAPGASMIIGDAQTDSLVVNSNSIFNNNVQIGSSNSDTLVNNATATHNGVNYYNSDVYFNTAQAGKQFYFSRSLGAMGYWNGVGSSIFIDGSNNTITSTNLNITGNTVLGDSSTDVLTNNSTSTHNARNKFNSDVSINSNLEVSGNLICHGLASFVGSVNFDGSNFVLGDTESDNLIVNSSSYLKNNVTIGENAVDNLINNAKFYNYGATIFYNDVSLNSRVDVSSANVQRATFQSDVQFNGPTVFAGSISAPASQFVVGDMQSDILTINSTTTLNNNVFIGFSPVDLLINNATSTHNAKNTFNNDVLMNSNTDISGVLTAKKAIFSSDVSFNGPVNFNSSINALGSSFVVGDAQTDSLVVNSNSIFNNNVQIGSSNSDILTSYATSTYNGTQYYNSDVNFNTAQNNRYFYFSRSLGAIGYWDISGSPIFIDGSNNKITSANLNVTGNTVLGNEATDVLNVNATSNFNNNVTLGNSSDDVLNVNSTSNFNSNITLGSSSTDVLNVNSTSNFLNNMTIGENSSDVLNVNSTSNFLNNVTIGGDVEDTLNINSQINSNYLKCYTEPIPSNVMFPVSANQAFSITVPSHFKRSIFVTCPVTFYASASPALNQVLECKLNGATVQVKKNNVNFSSYTPTSYPNTYNFSKTYNITYTGANSYNFEQFVTNLSFTFYPDDDDSSATYTAFFSFQSGTASNDNIRVNSSVSSSKSNNVSFNGNTGTGRVDPDYTLAYYQFQTDSTNDLIDAKTILSTNGVFNKLNVLGKAYLKSTSNSYLEFDGETGALTISNSINTPSLRTSDLSSGSLSVSNATFTSLNGISAEALSDIFVRMDTAESEIDAVLVRMTNNETYDTQRDQSINDLNTAVATKQNIINSSNRLNANLLATGVISNSVLNTLLGSDTATTIQDQLNLKLPITNGNLLGTPTAPTASDLTNNTQIATTAFVKNQIANLIGTAGSTLDTLGEISTALGADPNFATTITTLIGSKASTIDPTLVCASLSITPTLLSYLYGASSNIQTQLNGKQPTLTASSNLTIANLTTSSIVDNGNATIKGNSFIGDSALDSCTFYNGMTVTGLTKAMVGLSNVDNVSDISKGISYLVQSALDLKANDSAVVKLSGDQTISGIKTFSSPPVMSGASISSGTVPQSSISGLASALQYLDATSSIQNQLNGKQPTLTASSNLSISNLTTTSITDNGNATIKGNTIIGDSTLDSCTFYNGMTVSGLTKAMVGLGNVDNVSDANKPISTAQQQGLDLKANLNSPTFIGTVSGITKAMVGLGNVDNTSDANKPISTAQQQGLDLKADLNSPTFTGTVSGITKSMVGLSNVDNTADSAKPVSTAQQTALDLKANLSGASFSGSLVSQQTTSISEFVNPVTISSSIATCNYATSAVHLITGTTGSNFTCALTNINANSLAYRTFTVTLMIDSGTNKVYANALTVNGTSRTLIYNGGSSSVPTLTSATYILQTICVVFGASSTVPIACTTNIAPFF